MIENLSGIAYGLITFALVVGIGLVVLSRFAETTSGEANTSIQNLIGYLGTGNGGLVLWVPAVIALVIGVLFLALIGNRGKRKV